MIVLWGANTGKVPAWFLDGLREYLTLVLGLLAAVILSGAAWLSGLQRLYAYGLLTAVAFVGAYVLNAPIALALGMTGGVITVWGGVMLARFVRKHPKEIG
jgi:hypothetical protein